MTTPASTVNRMTRRLLGWLPDMGGMRAGSRAAGDVLPVRLGRQSLSSSHSSPVSLSGFDQALIWVTVALLMFGLVMVYSASVAMPDNPKFARYAHTHFLTRHVFSLVVASIVAFVAFQIPVSAWE